MPSFKCIQLGKILRHNCCRQSDKVISGVCVALRSRLIVDRNRGIFFRASRRLSTPTNINLCMLIAIFLLYSLGYTNTDGIKRAYVNHIDHIRVGPKENCASIDDVAVSQAVCDAIVCARLVLVRCSSSPSDVCAKTGYSTMRMTMTTAIPMYTMHLLLPYYTHNVYMYTNVCVCRCEHLWKTRGFLLYAHVCQPNQVG